jgi:hypothetical protein
MIGSEKTGCMFRHLHFVHDAEICEDEDCMICNEGLWEQSIEIYSAHKVHEMPLESEQEEDQAVYHEGECELHGKFLAGGSVICEGGECGVCFKGRWLHSEGLQ